MSEQDTRHRDAASLDALRGVAVAGVLFTHYASESTLVGIPGFVGVRLFFVMSGFLITRILLTARKSTVGTVARAFYARRFLRIFPLYYAACALMCLTSPAIREYLFWLVAYAQNIKFAVDGRYPVVAHLWSLAVEEQFYLFWPWVVLLVRSVALKRILLLCIALAIVTRAAVYLVTSNEVSTHVLPFACLDTLGTGALLALAHSRNSYPKLARWQVAMLVVVFCALTLALLSIRTRWLFHVFAEAILAVFFADLVGRVIARAGSPSLWSSVLDLASLQRIGKISYGIYVIHFFVPNQVVRLFSLFNVSASSKSVSVIALSVAATWVIAELSWRYLEAPLNRLKWYFPYDGATIDRDELRGPKNV